jgi:hypothetical protein
MFLVAALLAPNSPILLLLRCYRRLALAILRDECSPNSVGTRNRLERVGKGHELRSGSFGADGKQALLLVCGMLLQAECFGLLSNRLSNTAQREHL